MEMQTLFHRLARLPAPQAWREGAYAALCNSPAMPPAPRGIARLLYMHGHRSATAWVHAAITTNLAAHRRGVIDYPLL